MRQFATNRPRPFHRSLASSALICALFAACGGGGGGSTDPDDTDLEDPIVNLIDPVEGDFGGGTLVTLGGSGFMEGVEDGTVVTFGAVHATEVTVIDDNTITCVTPAGTLGDEVNVTVINSGGSGAACCFEYIDTSLDDPQITGIDPLSGEPEGGTTVTITGSNFTEVDPFETTVTFGGLEALDVFVLDDSTITCSSPPGVDGDVVEVMVSNPRGDAAFDGFTYADTSDDPVVTSVEPSVDLPAGGIAVTITGSQFTEEEAGETTVLFGENPALDAVVVDDAMILCSAPAGLDNTTVAVTVINPRGVGVLADAFSYLDPSDDPILDSIDPVEGLVDGGEVITLTGSMFTETAAGETSVLFGENPATDVLVVDDVTITCTNPAGDPGETVDVSVVNPRGTAVLSSAYHYIDPAADDPQITGIDPAQGEPAGGELVTISGSQFEETTPGETSVDFGGVPATDVLVLDDATITCVAPAGTDGDTVDVSVTNSRGSASFSGFSYVDTSDDPVITSIDPTEGLPAGGTVVTISGSQFTEATAGETTVLFGGSLATNVVVLDDATITCDSPAGADNTTVDVSVVNPRGTGTLCCFNYLDPSDDPVITGISPTEGDFAGGTDVTISGSHFTETNAGETSVYFGASLATDVVVVDDATISCTSPAGDAGSSVTVSVNNPRGSASHSEFTYTGGGPVLLAADPSSGAEAGGELVTITGERFSATNAGETIVSFGGSPATSVLIVDDGTITCVTPPGQGVVTISLSNALGSGELADSFTYIEDSEATAADLDGDGLMDLVVGAPMDDAGGVNAGSVRLFLSSGSLTSDEDLSASAADLTITGSASGDRFGSSVATGDLNEDGDEDLIVGAPHAAGGGMVYVFNGPMAAGGLSADAADHVFSAEGTAAEGSRIEDRFGSSITVRDLDGDGVDELVVGAPGADYAASGTSVYAAGLRSPMGLHVSSDGALWVAQSGSGSADPADPEGTPLDDSGVSRVASAGVVEEVVSGLPSVTDEGFAGGTSDLIFDSAGSLVVVQQNGGSSLSNSVLEFDVSAWSSGSSAQGPADVVTQWEIASFGESLGYDHNNAYGVAEGTDGHLYVVNAGSNSIFKIERPSGAMSEFATFPQVPQPSPVGPPFTDSVPTRILAHSGGFYVVNLTGFPFNDGAASVFDVDYAGNVTELAAGLSRATDVAVNPNDGSLYVTQFDGFDLTASPPWLFGTGSVVRVTGAGLETVAQVTTPTGVAFGADGTMYVSSMITGLIYRYAAVAPSAVADVGAVYVFHGGAGLGAFVHASAADVVLGGEASGDQFGASSGIGDFNGDGQMDLFVGASGASTFVPDHLWDGGAVFLWLGPVTDSGSYQGADASYYLLDEEAAMGSSLSIGDVNNDGFDDLIAGAPAADSEVALAAGLVLVFAGDQVVYSEYASNADVILHGMTANGGFGAGLLTADFNGDGTSDIFVTAPSESYGAVRNGCAFLFNGGPVLGDSWAAAADVVLTGRFRDFEHFGSSAGAIDRNDDGVLDPCVGAFGGDMDAPGAGSVHLFLGGGELVDSDAEMADLSLDGEEELGRFGDALSTGD